MPANIFANSLTPSEQDGDKKQKFYTINKGNNHKAYYEGKNIGKFRPNSLTPT